MEMILALILVILAGVMNGSFALPTKTIKGWQFENIWFLYAIFGFLILPVLCVWMFSPNILSVYKQASNRMLEVMLIGGFLFGVGQVCFAFALKQIGFGLGFVINIGLGTALGFLFPLIFLHPDRMRTPFGLATLLGTVVIIVGLVLSFYAGEMRDKRKQTVLSGNYRLGVGLAIIAGLFSAGQNFTFAYTSPLHDIAVKMGIHELGASVILWPGFLIATFIPYAAYMIYLLKKNNTVKNFATGQVGLYWFYAFVMGVFWYGSLIFYSKGAHLIGDLGAVVGWPIFMVLIILTSSFWGWLYGEWKDCSKKVKNIMGSGVVMLVVAVMILAYSVALRG